MMREYLMKKIRSFLGISARLSQKLHCVNDKTNKPHHFRAKYGGRFTVTMVVGDEYDIPLMKHVKDIFQFALVPVEFEEIHLEPSNQSEGKTHEVISSIRRNGAAIKGNIIAKDKNFRNLSQNVILRKELDLFANVLHCKSQPGIITKHNNVDIVLVRQNTEGEYSYLEHILIPGVVESLKITTRKKSEEIARFAFEYSVQNNRKKITTVHKANVMPKSDGLFLETCERVSKEYPNIQFDSMLLDTCCYMIVNRPQEFEVLLLTNLYGNVLSNIACGLVGGAGVVSGKNYGYDYAVFEIGCRGSVTLNNPVPLINASVDLLYYLGLNTYAKIIENSVYKTLNVHRIVTPDLGGSSNASDVVHHIMKSLDEELNKLRPILFAT